MRFLLLEFDFQREGFILIDSEKIIGNYREGALQKALLAYSHIPGCKFGNFKRKEGRLFCHDLGPYRMSYVV
jgi:hypothetical protein